MYFTKLVITGYNFNNSTEYSKEYRRVNIVQMKARRIINRIIDSIYICYGERAKNSLFDTIKSNSVDYGDIIDEIANGIGG